jgi:hypothetical protein
MCCSTEDLLPLSPQGHTLAQRHARAGRPAQRSADATPDGTSRSPQPRVTGVNPQKLRITVENGRCIHLKVFIHDKPTEDCGCFHPGPIPPAINRPLRRSIRSAAPRTRTPSGPCGHQGDRRRTHPGHGAGSRAGSANPRPVPAATAPRESLTRRCVRALVRSPLLYFAAVPRPRVFELCLTCGAIGIRTPDLLHGIQRQPVHPRVSAQVTVLPRPLRSARVQACCGTFLLYCPPYRPTGLVTPLAGA